MALKKTPQTAPTATPKLPADPVCFGKEAAVETESGLRKKLTPIVHANDLSRRSSRTPRYVRDPVNRQAILQL